MVAILVGLSSSVALLLRLLMDATAQTGLDIGHRRQFVSLKLKNAKTYLGPRLKSPDDLPTALQIKALFITPFTMRLTR